MEYKNYKTRIAIVIPKQHNQNVILLYIKAMVNLQLLISLFSPGEMLQP